MTGANQSKRQVITHYELDVYQKAFSAAMQVFELSKHFPKEEMYALTDQIRRSSRSVYANLAEAWRKRRYEKAFTSKLSDSEGEAAETQVWLEFAVHCIYIEADQTRPLYVTYDEIIRMIVAMIKNPTIWTIDN